MPSLRSKTDFVTTEIVLIGYLLYGNDLKREIFFLRNEIFFNAKNQRLFTYVGNERSEFLLSKFKK